MNPDRIDEAYHRLALYLSTIELTGFDPWQGLISPWARSLPRGLPQQVWIRACSLGGRPGVRLARLPALRMVKTLALVSLAQRLMPSSRFDGAALAADLQRRRNDDGGWGYEFDAQFRWGRYAAGTSNAVVTAFVVESMAQSTQISDRALLRFVQRDLVDPAGFFRYYAGSPVLIHNANFLMCRTAARLGLGGDDLLAALDSSVRCRTADGLWTYGDQKDLGWADIFHNAYVGWVLDDLAGLGIVDTDLARDVKAAWLRHFFHDSGSPKMLNTDSAPTRSVNAVATALYWLCVMENPPAPVDGRIDACASLLLSLQRPDGSFGDEGLRFPRWNDAPALLALAALRHRSGRR